MTGFTLEKDLLVDCSYLIIINVLFLILQLYASYLIIIYRPINVSCTFMLE